MSAMLYVIWYDECYAVGLVLSGCCTSDSICPPCRDEEIIMPDEHGGVVRENYLWKVRKCSIQGVSVLRCISLCGGRFWTAQESGQHSQHT